MEEPLLIQACKKQQPLAQKRFFDTHYPAMYHLARRYLGNHHDAEDVLIIAFNRIFKNVSRFEYRGEGSIEKWMATIVINESLRFLQQRKSLRFEEELSPLHHETQTTIDPDIVDAEEVYGIIATMPAGYWAVFNLFAIEGYAHKEIAHMLQISENTSKSQLSKARNFIIQRLKKRENYGIA